MCVCVCVCVCVCACVRACSPQATERSLTKTETCSQTDPTEGLSVGPDLFTLNANIDVLRYLLTVDPF